MIVIYHSHTYISDLNYLGTTWVRAATHLENRVFCATREPGWGMSVHSDSYGVPRLKLSSLHMRHELVSLVMSRPC